MQSVILIIIAVLKYLAKDKPSLTKRLNDVIQQLTLLNKKEWHKMSAFFVVETGPLKSGTFTQAGTVEVIVNAIVKFLDDTDEDIVWLCKTLLANEELIKGLVHHMNQCVGVTTESFFGERTYLIRKEA